MVSYRRDSWLTADWVVLVEPELVKLPPAPGKFAL